MFTLRRVVLKTNKRVKIANLVGMTAVKRLVGLLYQRCDAEACKLIKDEITRRCSDVEILTVVVVDKNDG